MIDDEIKLVQINKLKRESMTNKMNQIQTYERLDKM